MDNGKIIANIKKIYSDYKIPLNIQLHMLRTACVAEQIMDCTNEKVDREAVISVMLIHDTGNIAKMSFNKEYLPMLVGKEKGQIEELKERQKEFIKKYGEDDLEINIRIGKEIGIGKRELFLMNNKSLKSVCATAAGNDLELMLCSYADFRVGPFGVISIEERLEDARNRYLRMGKILYRDVKINDEIFSKWVNCSISLEQKIFEKTSILPTDINDESIKKYMDKYKAYDLLL